MNKYQEAYKFIDNLLDLNEDKRFPLVVEYLKSLQELVDKATPKKVIRKPVKHYVDYYCPNCDRKLSSRTTYHFCPKKDCGQALDWSDDK